MFGEVRSHRFLNLLLNVQWNGRIGQRPSFADDFLKEVFLGQHLNCSTSYFGGSSWTAFQLFNVLLWGKISMIGIVLQISAGGRTLAH